MTFRRSKSKLLVVLTLVLALMGQTLAVAAVSCTMMDNAPGKMAAMASRDHHGGHNMDTSASDEECCQQELPCPMSSCMPAGIMPSVFIGTSVSFSSGKIPFSGLSSMSAFAASLYRPPIFR